MTTIKNYLEDFFTDIKDNGFKSKHLAIIVGFFAVLTILFAAIDPIIAFLSVVFKLLINTAMFAGMFFLIKFAKTTIKEKKKKK